MKSSVHLSLLAIPRPIFDLFPHFFRREAKPAPSTPKYSRSIATMEAAFMDSGTTVDKVGHVLRPRSYWHRCGRGVSFFHRSSVAHCPITTLLVATISFPHLSVSLLLSRVKMLVYRHSWVPLPLPTWSKPRSDRRAWIKFCSGYPSTIRASA